MATEVADAERLVELLLAALQSHGRLAAIEVDYEKKVREYGERCLEETARRVEEERLKREAEIVNLEAQNNRLRKKRRRLVEALDDALDRKRQLHKRVAELEKALAAK
jgi:hypothetical protein